MNDQWHPSHRRSEETGKIKKDANEPFVLPPEKFYDDPPDEDSDDDCIENNRAEILRTILALLVDFLSKDPKKVAIRLAAFQRIAGHDQRSVRETAEEIGCGPSTLHDAEKLIEARLSELSRTGFQR